MDYRKNDPGNPSHVNPDGTPNASYYERQREERERLEREEAQKRQRAQEALDAANRFEQERQARESADRSRLTQQLAEEASARQRMSSVGEISNQTTPVSIAVSRKPETGWGVLGGVLFVALLLAAGAVWYVPMALGAIATANNPAGAFGMGRVWTSVLVGCIPPVATVALCFLSARMYPREELSTRRMVAMSIVWLLSVASTTAAVSSSTHLDIVASWMAVCGLALPHLLVGCFLLVFELFGRAPRRPDGISGFLDAWLGLSAFGVFFTVGVMLVSFVIGLNILDSKFSEPMLWAIKRALG